MLRMAFLAFPDSADILNVYQTLTQYKIMHVRCLFCRAYFKCTEDVVTKNRELDIGLRSPKGSPTTSRLLIMCKTSRQLKTLQFRKKFI